MNALQSSWSAIIKLCVMLTHASSNFIMTVFSKMLCVYILKKQPTHVFSIKMFGFESGVYFFVLFCFLRRNFHTSSLPCQKKKSPVAYHTGSGHRAFWLGVRPKTVVVSCNLNMNSRVLINLSTPFQLKAIKTERCSRRFAVCYRSLR